MYRYYINFVKSSPSWSQFWPNEDAKALNKRPDDREFYREEIDELKIKRAGPGRDSGQDNITVFDTLETWFFDATKFSDEIEIEIYRGTMATGTLYYKGFFSISDATINREYETFNIAPLIDDSYRDFVDISSAEFDIRNINELRTEDVIVGDYVTLGAWAAKTPNGADEDFDGFAGSGTTLILVVDSDAFNKEARNQSIGAVTNNLKVIIKISLFTLHSGTGPWIDIWDVNDTSITDEGAQQITDTTDIQFTINLGVTGYIVLHTTPANQVTDFSITLEVIKNGDRNSNSAGLFMDFIEEFITGPSFMVLTGFNGNVKSTFINNDALPSDAPSSIVSFITGRPNGNYVTLNISNPLNGFLASETRQWVSADVTEIQINFDQIMSDLKEVLQADWYIDADGDFRIEHISYFEKLNSESTALDLTSAPFDKYKVETDVREFNFNKALLANREQFRWQQVDIVANSEDFVGVDIIYDNLETVSNVLKHEPRTITTDLRYLVDNPGDASASGLTYLLGVDLGGGDWYIDFEEGVLSGNQILNGHFSWANLQKKYWKWRRMSENGDMNDGDTIAFNSAVKFLEQADLRFGYQTTLDGFTKITTQDGTAQQIETERDLATDFLTVLLAYNPYE